MTEHTHSPNINRLKLSILITALFLLVEVIGGLLSGSLALVSDAGHMLSDLLSLILSLVAMILATSIATKEQTYGLHRTEIFAGFINAVLLVVISGIIIWEAYQRFLSPTPIQGGIMMGVAIIGLIANLAIIHLLHGSHDLNMRSAFLHVLGDTLSSVAVIGAAVWIYFTGQVLIDPILSVIIGVIIIGTAVGLLRETIAILLQFAPRSVSFDEVIAEIRSVSGVEDVHHLHLWSLCSNIHVLDTHVYSCVRDVDQIEQMKQEIKERLRKYQILYSTLEFECNVCTTCSVVEEVRSHPE
ncbi:cation diffusion facilitator family transporter [uncultured Methanospirillum sp.]|uniref:cation diffusion facilitator family transporter n=1 Tax=uncultured Methanospirillum sp. TaxID=262503 RepID=UPI0029C6C879|nr:cation diffusion facilitator family transporter [uncultured Methanospirillum sp.]